MRLRHLLVAAALGLAGCAGGEEPATRPVAAEDRPACDVLREPDVAKAVLGASGRRLEDVGDVEVERRDSEQRSSCGYYAGRDDDVAVKLVIDRAANAQEQYWYRIQELNQRSANWSGPDPRLGAGC